MRIISDELIKDLNISYQDCYDWVKEAFLLKDKCQLPPKISLHPQGSDFINTMPCLLPENYHTFGCKVVSRISDSNPALKSHLLVVDSLNGDLKALMECDWITTMRTASVANLAIETFKNNNSTIYSFIGLGVIGKATLKSFLSLNGNQNITIKLYKYKDHAENIERELKDRYPNVNFLISDTLEDLVKDADVIVSCISYTDRELIQDISIFKPGVLIVPVHTRGFQNLDKIVDKVFADDEGHVKGFKYFKEFKNFGEIGDVLAHKIPGRENEKELIMSYNIGLGLHDIYYAYKILQILNHKNPDII